MKLEEYAKLLLKGDSLEDKLYPIKEVEKKIEIGYCSGYEYPEYPSRNKRIAFSSEQAKFPKKSTFHLNEKKAMALHFFANHELLAIEMMAAALLVLPTENKEDVIVKKSILTTIADEQKHFKLYQNRMNDFGLDFGDLPINDFFWRQMTNVKTKEQFFALVSLTFEQANLDFALFYGNAFAEFDDDKTSKIMQTVYDDEISHVALGQRWLNIWRGNDDLFHFYMENLPGLITPSRAKGMIFDLEGRSRAGLDQEYIENLRTYNDDFKITNRKQWKD